MALKKSFPLFVAVSLLCAPLAAHADSTDQVINGGTCIPFPPYERATGTFTGINYHHWLYGFSGTAFCHLTMTLDWPLKTLAFVVFTGWSQPGQVVTARLCVHSSDVAVACGSAATISGPSAQTNWVGPPPLPPYAAGAFVQFNFPPNSVSGVFDLVPVWIK
jgi:hypothetical protein